MEHCKRQHEMIEGNIYVKPNGKRQCLTCKRAANTRFAAKHNANRSGRKRGRDLWLNGQPGQSDNTPSLAVHPLCVMDVKFTNGARYRRFKAAYEGGK